MERRLFPDGETCPRFSEAPSGRVILASRMKLPIDPNSHFVETLLAVSSLKAAGCDVWLVMPYFIYSRQDRSFREGEPFSAQSVLDILQRSGVSRLFTVSSHADREKPMIGFSSMPAHNIDGFSLFGDRIRQLMLPKPMVIGADSSADFAASKVAAALGCYSDCLIKKRDLDDGSLTMTGNLNVKGRDVVIVDDIISSGATMENAIKLARESGASSVYVAAVHLTRSDAIDRLRPLVDGLFVTNTIETPVSEVSVTARIADNIKRMM
jgi:ribose-phosphate pyrophosphokinase